MKKSNKFFNDIKDVEAYLLANTSYGEEPGPDPEEQIRIEGDVLIVPATFDNMLPEVRIKLIGNQISLKDENGVEIWCINKQDAFDDAWFKIFDEE